MLRIKEIRKKIGLTQAQVADALGIHLTNYNKLENGTAEITLGRIEQIAKILGTEPADLIIDTGGIRHVKINQYVQAGFWSESLIWADDDWYDVAVPDDPELRQFKLYGAETKGPSMNRRYPEGTALVYTSMFETAEPLAPGRRYIVEIERADGQREATVKTLDQDDTGRLWLVPESNDPRFQAPIAVEAREGETIRVVGRIRFSVQREP